MFLDDNTVCLVFLAVQHGLYRTLLWSYGGRRALCFGGGRRMLICDKGTDDSELGRGLSLCLGLCLAENRVVAVRDAVVCV